MSENQNDRQGLLDRRQLLRGATGVAAAGALTLARPSRARAGRGVQKGRIKQSIVNWCFADYWDLEAQCKTAKQLGCQSIELVPPDAWPVLKKHGLQCAISPSHLFVQGMNNPRYQAGCLDMLRTRIDQSADFGCQTVISFTGYAQESGDWNEGDNPDLDQLPAERRTIEPDEGIKNCVAGFKKIVGHAERRGVNIAIEILNTRATDHPMKGHPGYQGDHVDYCMEIINRVGSPRLGLLFDIYHVQIMDGDIIRRIRQCGEAIKHVHTAGNPGRGELDDTQEINYPPCMKALLEIDYQGFVGQEFIPTRDPLVGLTQAVELCDV
jgi:hydroxypyruvate isomerase